jgi:hypothetical protein
MKIHQVLFSLMLAFAVPAIAQPRDPAELDPAVRGQVFELLSFQCGVAEVEARFRDAMSRLGPTVEPLLLAVLRDGAPEAVRAAAADDAALRYRQQRAWLAEHGKQLLGEDASRPTELNRVGYIDDVLRRLDVLYRENAVRGLGVVGGAQAATAVAAASSRDPDLAILAEQAVQEIRERK